MTGRSIEGKFATPQRAVTRWLGLAALAPALACSSLDRFDTKGKSAFCGEMVSAPRFHGGVLPDGVNPPSLSLRVELLGDRLTAPPEPPAEDQDELPEPYVIVGHVTSDDADRGLCHEIDRPLFEDAPLRTIPELEHDSLRLFEFGEGRDYNFMAWVDTTCQGTMLAIVSLMRNDTVEVRLLKPAALAPPNAESARRPGFGLFYLHREENGCDF